MHLVYKALEKYAIPSSLPPELLPPSKKKDSITLPGSIQVLPAVPPSVVPNGVNSAQPQQQPPLVQSAATRTSIVSPPNVTAPLIQPPPPLIPMSVPTMAAPAKPPLSNSTTPLPIKSMTPPAQNAPSMPPPPPSPASVVPFSITTVEHHPWVISMEEKVKYDTLFEQADLDRDGFVSGHEIKDVFLKSGVAQPVLAHIW